MCMWEQLKARKLKYKHSKNESYLKKNVVNWEVEECLKKSMVETI